MRYEKGDMVMHKLITIFLVLASTAFGADTSPSTTQGDTQAVAPTNSVMAEARDYIFTVQTDQETYDPGEKIVLAINVKYTGTAPVNFDVSAGPFFGNITVFRKGVPCPQTFFYKHTVATIFPMGKALSPSKGGSTPFAFI
jgi:hypothetical protein